jgi:hypothetical protein
MIGHFFGTSYPSAVRIFTCVAFVRNFFQIFESSSLFAYEKIFVFAKSRKARFGQMLGISEKT